MYEIINDSNFYILVFCIHKKILLTQVAQDFDEGLKENLKRKGTGTASNDPKRRKLDDENNASIINAAEVQKPIKIVKKKKTIELPQELLISVQVLKMESLMKSFGRGSFQDFHDHCVKALNENSHLVKVANDLTVEQADTNIWHELRIGRITASRLHETTRCTMRNGSLVDKFLGKRSGWSFAMMRGTVLEEFVFDEVKKEYPELQRAGLIMNHNVHPFFAASPDGLHEDFVLEIKCPGTANTFAQYINVDTLSKKYFAQIQLQMFITGKTKALLAVANLDFETTRRITKVWISRDEQYMETMLEQAMHFYEKAIFPALKRKFLK